VTQDDAAEGVLDPWVSGWLEQNPRFLNPAADLSPSRLAAARSSASGPVSREIARVADQVIEGIPVRSYQHATPSPGVLIYLHGGAFVLGSVAFMDNFARELAYASGATVISVEYRLAPEHPYPAGVDDCERVTRWIVEHAADLGAPPGAAIIAGESAGGNLATAVCLRLRDAGRPGPIGQLLVYPGLSGGETFPSKVAFDGLIIGRASSAASWAAYSAGRDLSSDPYAVPLSAHTLAGLPPALVLLGGCDPLRDEGRAYSRRLQSDGVEVEEVCFAGQPHGFMNFGFPASGAAFQRCGRWARDRFASWAEREQQPS
jgi:acetyl esterase